MDDRLSEKLGQRIVELARLATAIHLDEVLCGSTGQLQQTETGGAGEEKQRAKREG